MPDTDDVERAGPLQKAISEFTYFLKETRGVSANTVRAYHDDLLQLAEYLVARAGFGEDLSWARARTVALSSYVNYLEGRYSGTTVKRKIASIRSFFSFLRERGLITNDSTEGVTSSFKRGVVARSMTSEEVARLLQRSDERVEPLDARNVAMLELIYAAGLRVTELLALDISDLRLWVSQPNVTVRSRRRALRAIPLTDQAVLALDEYLKQGRPALLAGKPQVPALFVSRRGQRLTRQSFWLILRARARAVNLDAGVTSRTLRQSWAVMPKLR